MSKTGRTDHRSADILNDPELLDMLVEALFQEDIRTYQETFRVHELARRFAERDKA